MSMHRQSQTLQNHTTMDGYRRWRSSMVEQLICNQQVAGSSPIASSVEHCENEGHESLGRVPERSKGTDCKSVVSDFEGSNPSPSTAASVIFETMVGANNESAGVAQLVELQPSKLDVAGSRPVSRSTTTRVGGAGLRPAESGAGGFGNPPRVPILVVPAHLAQLAEHVLGKDEVTRSIRVVGSSKTARTKSTQATRTERWQKRNSTARSPT